MNYVKIYDGVLPDIFCRSVINKFEKHSEQHVKTFIENHKSFTELNLNQHENVWKPEIDFMIGCMQNYITKYKQDVGIDDR